MKASIFYDISTWQELKHKKPQKGSRPNSVFMNQENNKLYYFKQANANYPSEIWSEIIVSKLGQLANYNLLDYNVAVRNDVVGCLSESMISETNSEILHGVEILEDFVETFEITKKPVYSFQDLELICKEQSMNEKIFLSRFIEIMFFDALIGNTDRHSENWAFVSKINFELPDFKGIENKLIKGFAQVSYFATFMYLLSKKEEIPTKQFNKFRSFYFLPIYDSGSCLGRELQENSLDNYLTNPSKLTKYIMNGKSEIRWNGEKISLIDIFPKIYNINKKLSKPLIRKLYTAITNQSIRELVEDIDKNLPIRYNQFSLSTKRKEFIITLLQKRLEILKNLVIL